MRYERKFRIENIEKAVVLQTILANPFSFQQAFPERSVHNIYFDTADFGFLKNNIDGNTDREKARVRWYGDAGPDVREGMLEIKIKEGLAGSKKRLAVPPFSTADLKPLCSFVVQQFYPSLSAVIPVLYIRYQRMYFETFDKKCRLTLDWNIQSTSLLRSPYRLEPNHFNTDNACIIELKYPLDYEPYIDELTQYFPYRMTKNSKYVHGLMDN